MSLKPPSKLDPFLFPISDLSSCVAQSTVSTLEQVGIGAAYWDLSHQQLYWSPGLVELYQLFSNPFQKTFYDCLSYIHPGDRHEFRVAVEKVEATLEKVQVEYRLLVSHKEHWLRSCFIPGIENEYLTHIIELVLDISDLKSAQHACIESELRWKTWTACISDVLVETTLTGEIICTTGAITPLWGYSSDELKGINILSLVRFEYSPIDLPNPLVLKGSLVSLAATVLHKWNFWKLTTCDIHVDAVRQTLLFVFKPAQPFHLGCDIHPAWQTTIASSGAFVHHSPLPTLCANISEILAYFIQADCVHIYQYCLDRSLWRNVYDYRRHPNLPCAMGFEFPDQDNCISNSLRQSHPLRIDCWDYAGTDPEPEFMMQFAGAWIVIPIVVNTSIWGSILIIRFDEDEQWSDPEFNQAIAFGRYMSWAIAAQGSP